MLQMADKISYSGKALKEIRTGRRISIAEVAEATRVAKRHIINIEEENFSDIPAKIYFKGFLDSYLMFLGLNEAEVFMEMVERYDQWENRTI